MIQWIIQVQDWLMSFISTRAWTFQVIGCQILFTKIIIQQLLSFTVVGRKAEFLMSLDSVNYGGKMSSSQWEIREATAETLLCLFKQSLLTKFCVKKKIFQHSITHNNEIIHSNCGICQHFRWGRWQLYVEHWPNVQKAINPPTSPTILSAFFRKKKNNKNKSFPSYKIFFKLK